MTVNELMTELLNYPPDAVVVMAKDAEGNSYSLLDDTEKAWFLAETTWSGERETDTEDGISSDSIPAVFLWPTN